jgi:HD-like signal output (HDOD) protein
MVSQQKRDSRAAIVNNILLEYIIVIPKFANMVMDIQYVSHQDIK